MPRKISAYLFIASIFALIIVFHFFRILWFTEWVKASIFGTMLLSLIFWLIFSLSKVKEWFSRRSVQFGVALLVSAVGFVLLLGVANYFAFKSDKRWDWTGGRLHTLSDQSLRILDNLKSEVLIEAWSSAPNEFLRSQDIRDLLDNYKSNSNGKLNFEVKNPNLLPTEAPKMSSGNRLIIVKSAAGREVRIEAINEEQIESQLSNALINVQDDDGRKKMVCFAQGNKELILNDRADVGMTEFRDSLQGASYEAREMVLSGFEVVPDYCNLLILVGPKSKPMDKEIKMISAYLDGGGALLALFGPQTPSEWGVFFEKYKLGLNQDVVHDPRGRPSILTATRNFAADSGLFDSFNDKVISQWVRTLKVPSVSPVENSTIKVLLSTESITVARRGAPEVAARMGRPNANDVQGPHPIAVLVERNYLNKDAKSTEAEVAPKKEGAWNFEIFSNAWAQEPAAPKDEKEEKVSTQRMILMGTSFVASNALIDHGYNKDVLLTFVNYLLEDLDQMGIRPRPATKAKLLLTEDNIYQVQGFIVLMAFVFLFAGLRAYQRRKA